MIDNINVEPKAYQYAIRHQLIPYLKKSINKIKQGQNTGIDLKKRVPKSDDIWSFRITKKYRAYCRKQGSSLTIYEIDDHQ